MLENVQSFYLIEQIEVQKLQKSDHWELPRKPQKTITSKDSRSF